MAEHPITPPPELVQQWWDGTHGAFYEFEAVATQAARWGADQELEACCAEIEEWTSISNCCGWELSQDLSTARRPKPLSLKEKGLNALQEFEYSIPPSLAADIRRALEALPNE